MAKKWTVSVDGQEELIRRLKAVLTIVRREVGAINRDAAIGGLDQARKLVPIRTGELFNSLELQGGGMVWRFGSYGLERPIARFVEYGTKHTPAHPFLHPAEEGVRATLPTETRTLARALPFLVAKE